MTDLDLDAPSLTTRIEGQIGWVIINSPKKLNSLNEDMWQAFPQHHNRSLIKTKM